MPSLAAAELVAPARPLPAPPRREPRAPAPWPQIAAVFPGVIVHGAGTFLQGRSQTTQRLLLMEGAGLLATVLSGFVLFQTGAARDWVGPAALVGAAGASTFGLSFLTNVYATWAPPEGLGQARRQLPLLESRVGYLYVEDPQFDFQHFLTTSVEGRLGPWHLEAAAAHAPAQSNQRYELLAGYRWLGPRAGGAPPARDGSYLEPVMGFSEHRFDSDGFLSRVLELQVQGRLDSERYLPDVRGAFFQLGAGYARQWLVFDLPGVDTTTATSLLLAHMGFGVYLGNRSGGGAGAPGGEVELYYDHRHDGFAAGMKSRGLGSGPAGHAGLSAAYQFTPRYGVRAQAEVGSAWVFGLSWVLRAGVP